eukprot:757351-Hanusia_phi.AAC.4
MPKTDSVEFADVAETVSTFGLFPGTPLQCPMGVKVEVEGVGKKDKVLYLRYPSDIVAPSTITDLQSLVSAGYKMDKSFLRDLVHLVDADVLKALAGHAADTITKKSLQTEIEPNMREYIMQMSDRDILQNLSRLTDSAVQQVSKRILSEKKAKAIRSPPPRPTNEVAPAAVNPVELVKKYFDQHYDAADLPENVKMHFSQFPVPNTPETKTKDKIKKKKAGKSKTNKTK